MLPWKISSNIYPSFFSYRQISFQTFISYYKRKYIFIHTHCSCETTSLEMRRFIAAALRKKLELNSNVSLYVVFMDNFAVASDCMNHFIIFKSESLG